LSWKAPKSNGGCSIISYSIFKDDGNGGLFNEVDSTIVNNNPSLRSYPIAFLSADTKKTFRYFMEAKNVIGIIQTDIVSFVLAAVPSKPPTSPYLNLD